MKATICKNGHHYDEDSYPDGCPHCRKEGIPTMKQEDFDSVGKTVSMSSQVTPTQGGMPPATGQYEETVKVAHTQPLSEVVLNWGDGKTIPMDRDTTPKTVRYYPKTGFDPNFDPVVGWLVVLTGTDRGYSYELKAQKNLIGRNVDMDIVLKDDTSVSRSKHAIVTYEPKSRKFFVVSGESKGLVYVDDQVVLTSVEIVDRQIITVGQTDLMLVAFCGETFAWEDLKQKKDGE